MTVPELTNPNTIAMTSECSVVRKPVWRRTAKLVSLAWLSSVALSSVAAEPADADSFFEEVPVVLSASRLSQSVLEAPAAVTVINREMIAASGARRLADVLRLVPGFYVGYLNGNSAAAAYHGLSDYYARRMQVLIDGVSIYSPLLGQVDWTELPLALEDVERIEVVRGPNSVTYGANAFLAVINIMTRHPLTEQGGEVVVKLGGNGIRDAVARHTGHANDLHYSLTLGQRNDQGYERLPDSSQISFLNLHTMYQATVSDTVSVEARASSGKTQQGQAIANGFYSNATASTVQGDPPRDRRLANESVQARWTHAMDSEHEFWWQIHHQQQRSHELSTVDLPLPGGASLPYSYDTDFETTRDAIEFQHTQKLNDPLRLVWGGEWRQDSARSHAFLETDLRRKNRLYRLFGHVEYRPLDTLTLHGGAMFERNSISGNSISPRLAATWLITPEQSLRVGISRANRAPTINEEYGSLVFPSPPALNWLTRGTPLTILSKSSGGLRDERILSREIGYTLEKPDWRLSGDIRVFNDQVERLIGLTLTQPVVTMSNTLAWDYVNSTDTARVQGIEASLRWRPWAGGQLQATATRTRITSAITDSTQSDPSPLFSLLYMQDLPGETKFSAGYYRVGSMKWQSSPDSLAAYNTLDLRLARQFRMAGQKLEIALVTRNALGGYASYKPGLYDRRVSFIQVSWAY